MIIGGFQKFSLIDYPGKICAIVFTQGCNFRCPYCHNPELIDPNVSQNSQNITSEDDVFSFLEKRKGKLDAVEITGGEPTLQQGLLEFLKKIKDMGYLAKLDSNGSRPEVIEKIIRLKIVDYLAMDVKAPLEKYQEITCSNINPNKIKKSIELVMNSGLDYEFRTTVIKSQLSEEDIIEIVKLIKGANLYVLQKFIPSKTLNPKFLSKASYSDEEFEYLKAAVESYVVRCLVR
jgi:anaerobic ribonucleoside-triphosphate reductase activating protein